MPESDAYATAGYEPPQGETETKLAAIWAEVLRLDRVGRQDNFFSLGGHSLMAVRMVNRIRNTLHIDLSLSEFLSKLTFAALADHLTIRSLQQFDPVALSAIAREFVQ